MPAIAGLKTPVPPLYPAQIPPGWPPPEFISKPELIFPLAVIEIRLEDGTLVAELLELIPVPPELMISPIEVVTTTFELLFVLAWIPQRP